MPPQPDPGVPEAVAVTLPWVPPPPPDYPALGPEHVAPDARLFHDRLAMLPALCPEKGLVIGEVGVGLGHLSVFILNTLQPRLFVAIDAFGFHTLPDIWGTHPTELFGTRNHRQYYEDLFAWHRDTMDIREGPSDAKLAEFPDATFDLLYIDADHTYAGVKRDIAVAVQKIKPDGLLVFNDYLLQDLLADKDFGVVQAVNELVAGSDWKVVGFSLQQQMYCDIALRRFDSGTHAGL